MHNSCCNKTELKHHNQDFHYNTLYILNFNIHSGVICTAQQHQQAHQQQVHQPHVICNNIHVVIM